MGLPPFTNPHRPAWWSTINTIPATNTPLGGLYPTVDRQRTAHYTKETVKYLQTDASPVTLSFNCPSASHLHQVLNTLPHTTQSNFSCDIGTLQKLWQSLRAAGSEQVCPTTPYLQTLPFLFSMPCIWPLDTPLRVEFLSVNLHALYFLNKSFKKTVKVCGSGLVRRVWIITQTL